MKTIGEHGCNLIICELSQIIKSHKEYYFYKALYNARMLLSNQQQRDVDLETNLEAVCSILY